MGGFVREGSSDDYVLLGGGGHMLLSDIPKQVINNGNTIIKYVHFSNFYGSKRIIVPFKFLNGGSHEACLFPIYTAPDGSSSCGMSLIWLENYTVGGQNNKICNMGSHTWAVAGSASDGRVIIEATSSGYGWTYYIPWIMWTAGPHWAKYYNLDFSVG